jgi:hypothetical protein
VLEVFKVRVLSASAVRLWIKLDLNAESLLQVENTYGLEKFQVAAADVRSGKVG